MATTQTGGIVSESPKQAMNRSELARRVVELGDWFHNLDLHGVRTAPRHFLGDFPRIKWMQIAHAFPQDLAGASVLDIGCNAGFYCLELKKRGAGQVLGVDIDDRYLSQARFAAEVLGLDVEFAKYSVYDVDQITGQFDMVLFMGVFYHLRYPLYALDKIITKVRSRLVFQTMIRGALATPALSDDYPFWNKEIFERPGFPGMYFIENKYAGDPTNWWIPNHAGMEAVLRSSGLEIESHPESETWVCRPARVMKEGKYILEHELAGTL